MERAALLFLKKNYLSKGNHLLPLGAWHGYCFADIRAIGRPAHYDMRFVKPLDIAMLHEVFSKFDRLITVEDGCIQGGFGSAVLEFMADQGYSARVKRLGIPDEVIEQGEQIELQHIAGFCPQGIANAVRELVGVAVGR
jgi:deoxyxylulose-5-phosphate synthase